ncbi:MAG TPA: helix-turn-helix transcriptional regulator [Actinomycetota bacterium]|jgi:DNA-binding CsgD family transcriptional regulator
MGTLRRLPTLFRELPEMRRLMRELTPAESRILELVALGLSSREIAARMSVTRQAVTWHIGNLFVKFGAQNRAGLVARAYAMGLLASEAWPPNLRQGLPRAAGAESKSVE